MVETSIMVASLKAETPYLDKKLLQDNNYKLGGNMFSSSGWQPTSPSGWTPLSIVHYSFLSARWEGNVYVVLIDGIHGDFSAKGQVCQTLEQAFAKIACHAGLSYAFEPQEHGWELVLTDVERPDQSPDPVYTTCIKPRDAQHDLMA
jgi:hypothetical protein